MFHGLDHVMHDEESRKAFGKRLKDLRNKLRWTQKEVAAKIGLQLSQFNKYESGMHVPRPRTICLLARCRRRSR
jgi:transcriptional regulator with XRE-family HTH domain